MTVIRIKWKDVNGKANKPVKYRKHTAIGYGDGWVIDIPGDNNIYKSHYCALNAIDKHLGDDGKRVPSEKRSRYGIQIIGKRADVTE